MAKYLCVIWSDSSYPRQYEVESTSAIKAAEQYGCGELGEVVSIARKRTWEVISRAAWDEQTKRYYHVWLPKKVMTTYLEMD